MRSLIVVLILAGSVLAQEADTTTGYRGVVDGSYPLATQDVGISNGYLNVDAVALIAAERAFALSTLLSPDVCESEADCETTWFTLTFSGGDDTSDHQWKISSAIKGDGYAAASASLQGSSSFYGTLMILMSGDIELAGNGVLEVSSAGPSGSVSVPPGVTVDLDSSRSSSGSDCFKVDTSLTAAGEGKSCRVRVDTSVKATVQAETLIGSVSASSAAELEASLRMEGTYTIKGTGKKIKEVFEVRIDPPECKPVVTEEPTLGWGPSRDNKPPTDQPTEEERKNGRTLEKPFEPYKAKPEATEEEEEPAGDGAGTATPKEEEEEEEEEPESPAGTASPGEGSTSAVAE